MGNKYALLIGNSDYEDDHIPNLTKPRRNIEDFEKILTDPGICGFEPDHIKILADHPMSTVREDIARFFTDKSRDDFLLLYFSGHGFLDNRRRLYLSVRDTKKHLLKATAISASFISEAIGDCRAKNQVIVLDCCFSGAFKGSGEGAPGSNVVVLTASDATEFAWEHEESLGNPEHSVFTHYLIAGLKTGEADGDTDGWISVTELYEYISGKMVSSKQKPVCLHPFSRQEGKIIFAKNPGLSPAQVPQSLLDGHYFISYSPLDGEAFALELYEGLALADIPVWMDRKDIQDAGPSWEDQVLRAIETCAGLLFIGTSESVCTDADCRAEWTRALKYKKPVIPVWLHAGLELPHRLSGRKVIDFSHGDLASNVTLLCDHLKWLATPRGQVQALKDRRRDAQNDLRRANSKMCQRIRDEIAQLDRDIENQQKVADDPQAVKKRVKESIERGLERERKPEKPARESCAIQVCTRFINPPPAMAPSYFQDRHVETRLVADFLKDNGRCLLTVSGRGGIGKTAMICRVLHALENGQFPDDLGRFSIRGIVYLSAVGSRKIIVPHLFADLCRLVPSEISGKLDVLYRDPLVSVEKKMNALLSAFPSVRGGMQNEGADAGPVILLMDNFEDVVNTENRQIRDAELDEAVRAILDHPPHAVKIIITTRIVPHNLPTLRPERQMPLPLDDGLESPYAEQILREMDVGGAIGLKDAPDELLDGARVRTRGYPRALEALFAILAADRDTGLEEILADAEKLLPENVVEVLVGEAFNRLDILAQKVMQGLAIYGRPVTPIALDYLLESWLSGVDAAPVLNRLVNMQFVRKEEGRYYLHPVDREYALTRIPMGEVSDREGENGNATHFTQFALNHQGAEYYKQARLSRAEWKTLDDLKPQLAEFDLRYASEDYDTAADVLLDIDGEYLDLWGHYRLMIDLHEKLQDRIADSDMKEKSVGNMGSAYYSISQVQKAIGCYEQALSIARESKSRYGEAAWLGNLSNCYYGLGQTAKAIEYYEQALKIDREIGFRQGEAIKLNNLGNCYYSLGQTAKAIEYCEQALKIDREIGFRQGEAADIGNLGNCYSDLGQTAKAIEYYEQALKIDREIGHRNGEAIRLGNIVICYSALGQTAKAIEYHEQALKIDREIGYRQGEAQDLNNLGDVSIDQNDFEKAIHSLNDAIQIVDEIGFVQTQNEARHSLVLAYLYTEDLPNARITAETAQKFDYPTNNHNISALLGVITLRQNEIPLARQSFETAVSQADHILNQTPQFYEALDAKALALSGLALCEIMKGENGNPQQYIESAKDAYQKARTINADAGIVRRVLRLFDALAVMDKKGKLKTVREAVEGFY
ncbi:MAG: tetratricopeptide repeat protein [Desulfobacterales bacterium]|nr:tetratricopeptide repeat protein [Desulfobacterales bacterium]